jgi:hypothetical protein
MNAELRGLWETAPLWRGAVYVAMVLSGVVIIEMMTGSRGQHAAGGGPVPPPVATGRGTYASPFPAPAPTPVAAPPPTVVAPMPAQGAPPARAGEGRTAPVARVRPTQDIDPSVLDELDRQTRKEPFAVMPGQSRPRPRTLEELQ